MRGSQGNYRNPCLTMHQPWASLLVYGIKRIEGRSWPAPIRGRLWIHAAGKIPDEATIKAMEEFYKEIYAVDGITDIKFPEHYPVSRLLGCIEVVGCVRREELANWEALPEGVRLEGQTDFCWLCEQPQRLVIPFEMRGFQGVYNLEKKIYEAAVRGLTPVEAPLPVKFLLPDSKDRFSLKPGSISASISEKIRSGDEKSSSLTAAIAGARAAATQFSKKGQNAQTDFGQDNSRVYATRSSIKSKSVEKVAKPRNELGEASSSRISMKSKSIEEGAKSRNDLDEATSSRSSMKSKSIEEGNNKLQNGSDEGSSSRNSKRGFPEVDSTLTVSYNGESNHRKVVSNMTESRRRDEPLPSVPGRLPGGSKIFAAAMRSLKPS